MASTPGAGEGTVRYDVCGEADVAEMARLLGEVFAGRDPPAVAVGLTPAEFAAFVRLFGERVSDGLTIVARRAETGEMIGALLTEDLAAAPPVGMDGLTRKLDPIFDLLGELDAEFRAGQRIGRGDALHLYLLGVAAAAAGEGVGRGLVSACLANGAAKGYRRAVTEATNLRSQHVFRELGFVERVRRSYADHRHGGQAIFASIADQGGPILMERRLDG